MTVLLVSGDFKANRVMVHFHHDSTIGDLQWRELPTFTAYMRMTKTSYVLSLGKYYRKTKGTSIFLSPEIIKNRVGIEG